MYGNVSEWCSDLYEERLPGGSLIDPTGPAAGGTRVKGKARVRRGGVYWSESYNLHAANRGSGFQNDRHFDVGFRIALTSAP
jgi:formylglycine-generating enzyme required for sulfatase activity